jgi:hypothetical protein
MKNRLLALALATLLLAALSSPPSHASTSWNVNVVYQWNLMIFNANPTHADALDFYRQPDNLPKAITRKSWRLLNPSR